MGFRLYPAPLRVLQNQIGMNERELTPEMLDNLGHEAMMECRRNSVVECDVLIAAEWRYELPEIVNHNPPKHDWSKHESEPWQWYWRSPPKRKNSKGRKYWSTTQAFNALKRQQTP